MAYKGFKGIGPNKYGSPLKQQEKGKGKVGGPTQKTEPKAKIGGAKQKQVEKPKQRDQYFDTKLQPKKRTTAEVSTKGESPIVPKNDAHVDIRKEVAPKTRSEAGLGKYGKKLDKYEAKKQRSHAIKTDRRKKIAQKQDQKQNYKEEKKAIKEKYN